MDNFITNLIKRVKEKNNEDTDSYFPLDVANSQKKIIPPIHSNAGDKSLKDRAIEAIKTVYDPEIPVDIYELGLIYEVKVSENNDVAVLMTLTSPGCFAAGQIPGEVEKAIAAIDGVNKVYVELTFDPPWDKSMMSEAAQLELGFW